MSLNFNDSNSSKPQLNISHGSVEKLDENDLIVETDNNYEETTENTEKTTYDKIKSFFEDQQILNFSNFEIFLHCTELNIVIDCKDINILWEKFQILDNCGNKNDEKKQEFDFTTTINLLEKLLEQYEEMNSELKIEQVNTEAPVEKSI